MDEAPLPTTETQLPDWHRLDAASQSALQHLRSGQTWELRLADLADPRVKALREHGLIECGQMIETVNWPTGLELIQDINPRVRVRLSPKGRRLMETVK